MVLNIKKYILYIIWYNKNKDNIDVDFWENLKNKDIEESEEIV